MRVVTRWTAIGLVAALGACATVGPEEGGGEYVLMLEAPAGIHFAGSLSVYFVLEGDDGLSHAMLELNGTTDGETITWSATEIASAGIPAGRSVRVIGLQLHGLTRLGGVGTVRLVGLADGVVEAERTLAVDSGPVDLVLGSVPAGF